MHDNVNVVFEIPYLNLPVTNVVVMSWIAMAVIILLAFLATRKLKEVPTGFQNAAEVIIELLTNFMSGFMGDKCKKYIAYVGTLALFLIISNTLGALFMSELTSGVIAPITRSFAVPVALAIMTIVLAIIAGIREKGGLGFLKSLFKPVPILFPFKLLEFITKPLSLSMRLFGNILGAYILMEMLFANLPWIVPSLASIYFDIFDGGLQAFVFTLLTILYISEEVTEEED